MRNILPLLLATVFVGSASVSFANCPKDGGECPKSCQKQKKNKACNKKHKTEEKAGDVTAAPEAKGDVKGDDAKAGQ